MNFKTTLILIVLLGAAGVALYFTRERAASDNTTSEMESSRRKLVDIRAEDVTRIAVAPARGAKVVLEKQDGDWRLREPVDAPADPFEVDSLVRSIVELESQGTRAKEPGASSADSSISFTIELMAGGQQTTVHVWERSAVGGTAIVSVVGYDERDEIVSADFWQKLESPPEQYRKKNLVEAPTTDVKQITLTRSEGPRLVMQRSGEAWRLVEPESMPLEKTEVDDLLFGLSGLRAEEFVDGAASPSMYQLDHPQVTVVTSTEAPSTQPATAAATQATARPAGTTVKIGRYADVRQQSVYASIEAGGATTIAKVPGSVVKTFDVSPLDLRDRKVLDLAAEQVSGVRIVSDLPATTRPTMREASRKEIVLAKRVEPATMPATAPATTQAATAPAAPPAAGWVVASAGDSPADESKVSSLLQALHPLRATTFVESTATTRPADTHVVTISTGGLAVAPVAEHVIRIVDRGGAEPPIGSYNGLSFELDRTFLSRLTADFTTQAPDGATGSSSQE